MNHSRKIERSCALCKKRLKGIFRYNVFGKEFCADCYGYVLLFCKTPEDVGKYSIDQLKAMHKKARCDLCGKKVSSVRKKFIKDGVICKDCEKLLRPYYPKDRASSLILNGISAAISVATDTPGTMAAFDADDPMEKAGIGELREKYGKAITGG